MGNYRIIEFGSQFDENNIERTTINLTKTEVINFIDLIKNEIELATPDFVKIKKLCLELISNLPIPIQFLQDTFILRSRENINGEVFNNSSQLSYNPHQNKIELGRFNLKGESVFYASLPFKELKANGQMTSLLESCKELFDSKSNFETKYFTIGKWKIINPIKFVVLTFYSEAENKNEFVKQLNVHFRNYISSKYSQDDLDKYLLFCSFFSEAAAKKYDDAKKYLLTTGFLHAIKEYYGNEIGILYSSSITENDGLNIIITKEFVDIGVLKLEGVVMFKAVRDKENIKSYNLYPCTNYALANENGKFNFDYIL